MSGKKEMTPERSPSLGDVKNLWKRRSSYLDELILMKTKHDHGKEIKEEIKLNHMDGIQECVQLIKVPITTKILFIF